MKGPATARKAYQRINRAADPWLTPNEAAAELRISRPTVLSRIIDGTLVAEIRAGRTFISRESIERALATKESV